MISQSLSPLSRVCHRALVAGEDKFIPTLRVSSIAVLIPSSTPFKLSTSILSGFKVWSTTFAFALRTRNDRIYVRVLSWLVSHTLVPWQNTKEQELAIKPHTSSACLGTPLSPSLYQFIILCTLLHHLTLAFNSILVDRSFVRKPYSSHYTVQITSRITTIERKQPTLSAFIHRLLSAKISLLAMATSTPHMLHSKSMDIMAIDHEKDLQWIWNDKDVIFVVFCGQLSRDTICSPRRGRIIVVPDMFFMQNKQSTNYDHHIYLSNVLPMLIFHHSRYSS